MGALTSKPYSFTARPWELIDRSTYDTSDTYFSPIKVSVRGNSVIRILPNIDQNVLSEWISDKIRFSYDSINHLKDIDIFNFRKVKFSSFWISFFSKRFSFPNFANNSFELDISTVYRLKNLAYFSGFSTTYSFNSDFRDFGVPSLQSLTHLLIKYKFIFLLGFNIRYSFPVFSVSIRRFVEQNDVSVFNFGFFTNNLLNEVNLGYSHSDFYKIFRGSSRVSRFITVNIKEIFFFIPTSFNSIAAYLKDFIPYSQIFTVYTKPFEIVCKELSFSFFNKQVDSYVTISPFVVHPFRYLGYQIRDAKYTLIPSLFTSKYYGNSITFFNKTLTNSTFWVALPFNFFCQPIFVYSSFYSHFLNFNSVSRYSSNILLSVKRQIDERSSFNYYI
jgi:hypothetical protein